MCSCLDSVTQTSVYGVDALLPPAALGHRRSGTSMRANVPESGKCVQHFLTPRRRDYGFTEYLLFKESVMPPNLNDIEAEAMKLSIEERADLADRLWASLEPQAAVDAAW